MKHKDLKFGQIVEEKGDKKRFIVLGTAYEKCYNDIMFSLDFMPCALYKLATNLEDTLNSCMIYNNVYVRSIDNLNEVNIFTEKEFLLHQEKCRMWLMKSKILLGKTTLLKLAPPEENYKRLMQEKEVIKVYAEKFDKGLKSALLRQPLTTDLKEKRIYLPQNVNINEDPIVVFYKYNKVWYRTLIEKPYGLSFLHSIYQAKRFDCDEEVALIDTNLDLIGIQWIKNWYS